jgi:DNA-binding CsgD family transcriptional regulator
VDQEPFKCHPECTKRSYWRGLLVEIQAEASCLTPGRLVDLILAVVEAEAEEWDRARSITEHAPTFEEWRDRTAPASPTGRKVAIELWLRGWTEWLIDSTLGYPHGTTERVLAGSRFHPKARDVVAAHLEGHTPSRISRDLKIARPTIDGILESIGEVGHQVRSRAASAVTNHAVIALYEDLRRSGSKKIYEQIATKLGITEQSVRSRLQYARRKGKITDPPLPRSNVKRRRPRAAE